MHILCVMYVYILESESFGVRKKIVLYKVPKYRRTKAFKSVVTII